MNTVYQHGFPTDFPPDDPQWLPARITQMHKNLYRVSCPHGEANAILKGSFAHALQEAEGYPAVGDYVYILYNPQGSSQIVRVLPRRSKFSRPDYSGHAAEYVKNIVEQVVAANFDFVFILSSLNQDFSAPRIQRYVAAAWQSGGQPVVLLTKADLCNDPLPYAGQVEAMAPGVPVLALSVVDGRGVEALSQYLSPGKTGVFLGMSGVGKSSLVNALSGGEIMAVRDIREDDARGRHTTTHRQLLYLPNGAMVIDTPGMREISLWDAEEGLESTFADVEQWMTGCKFSDCRHQSEPGCALQAAIQHGNLSQERYDQYLRLKKESRFTEDKSAYLREKRAWHKSIAQHNRKGPK